MTFKIRSDRGIVRRSAARAGSWTVREHTHRAQASSRSSAGSPRLPPTPTFESGARATARRSTPVTVLLPLVPVTPITGAACMCEEQLDVADQWDAALARAARAGSCDVRRPGLTTIRSAAGELDRASRSPRISSTVRVIGARVFSANGGAAACIDRPSGDRSRARKRTHEKPVVPRPNITVCRLRPAQVRNSGCADVPQCPGHPERHRISRKGNAPSGDLLVALMAFSSHQHDVRRHGGCNCALDSRRAIQFHVEGPRRETRRRFPLQCRLLLPDLGLSLVTHA